VIRLHSRGRSIVKVRRKNALNANPC